MTSWYIIAIVILVVTGVLLLRFRNTNQQHIRMRSDQIRHALANEGRNYSQEREEARLAHMSVEERDWETAALQRNRANVERDVAATELPA
jgi:hypothetical protein